MPFRIGVPELILVLVIIILIFGVGRLTKIGGEIGNAFKAFRKSVKGDEEETTVEKKDKPE